MSNKRKKGYTLKELLIAVIIFAIVLSIIGFFIISKSHICPRISKTDYCKSKLQTLELSLVILSKDIGRFPNEEEGLNILFANNNIEGWKGPYFNKRNLNDPWGNEFKYILKENKIILLSFGLDKKQGSEDDIKVEIKPYNK